MNTEDIKPGAFCYHYKKPDKIYQIVGIARTVDTLRAKATEILRTE
jgi:hypothetical protein